MNSKMFYLLLLVGIVYAQTNDTLPDNIYGFSALDIDGKNVSFEKYKGHPLLVVNVASTCTLTESNYRQLNDLFTRFEKQGLRIAAFPSNSFGQENGSAEDIKQFLSKKEVKFDVYAKTDVNGDNTHPIYKWLKEKKPGFLGTTLIKWNFTKFLVNKQGQVTDRYAPTTSPASIETDIKALMA